MPFRLYRQYDSMDCGPNCLQMVGKHYGKSFSIQTLRDKTQIGKEGVNMLGISEAAESIGFRASSQQLTYPKLVKDALLPSILHWDQNHFVVLYKAKRNKLFVADPAKGLIRYSEQEFRQHWITDKNDGQEEGIALLLEPTPKFYEVLEDAPSASENMGQTGLAFKNIFNYILPYNKFVFQLFLGLGVASIIQLLLPFLTQSVVDVGVNTGNIHFVYIVLLAQLALFAGKLVVDFVRSWLLLHISTRINVSILTDFLIKLMRLPVSFFDSKRTGDILQRMNDHSRIESFLTGSSLNVLFSFINLLIFSAVLALFNFYIFVVFLSASIAYALWVILFLKKRKQLDYKRFDIAAREQGATIQMVQGMQEIKLHGCEKTMRWNWESLQARLFKLSMKSLSLNQWQQSGAFFINEGKNIFITFLAAKAVIDGQMTLGTMLAVQYIIGQLNSPIEQMIGFIQSWQNAKISMDRLNEIHTIEDEEPAHKNFLLELPASFTRRLAGGQALLYNDSHQGPVRDDYTNGNTLESIQENNLLPEEVLKEDSYAFSFSETKDESSIILKNVSFTYTGAGNEPVLKNINLNIPVGKTTAIVGVSGSGKTTLLKLLLKFYEAQRGEIRLTPNPRLNDSVGQASPLGERNEIPGKRGANLSNISHRVWRSHCGVVMQESFVFSDTIAKNIAVGVEKIDMDRLYHAVKVANINHFIDELPLGFNTKIGPEGTGISMGQKQRILIARAVYRNPDFIFFDEATNSLDANNESVILNNLQSFFNGRTVVVVAHRLSTVKNADQIVVLNNGEISERGTHHELINLKREYYTLVKNQLELGG